MATPIQQELPVQTDTPLFCIDPDHPNVNWLILLLEGSEDWITAAQVCAAARRAPTDQHKRWVRALANASSGQVACGQRGYKLVRKMTGDEYQHYRNWMNHQAEQMKRRVIECDHVFYARQPLT